jgi:hypothetical protein
MRTDTLVKIDGMKILSESLGIVDAERFIALMAREPFDYTEWRQNLKEEANVKELSKLAMDYQETLKHQG